MAVDTILRRGTFLQEEWKDQREFRRLAAAARRAIQWKGFAVKRCRGTISYGRYDMRLLSHVIYIVKYAIQARIRILNMQGFAQCL